MTKNVGSVDKVVRVVAGIALVAVGIVLGGAWWAAAAVGAVLLFTVATSFCGLYTLLGVNTCKVKNSNS
ncbi:MAG: DUF2892 domain-containing protein [Spirochaetaceae bacterium]|nr:MAG: DUF2892 domain-containing protein [Spirochaetaceae bacterium]